MDKSAHIAIDMGAGSIRIMLGTIGDKLKMEEVHRFENKPIEDSGQIFWNLPLIEEEIAFGIKKALSRSDIKVDSVSTDSWGVDFVLLKNDVPQGLPVAYRDARTEGMQEKWDTLMSREETFKKSGINFYPFNSLFQFLAIKGSNELVATEKILFIACYINYFLGGRIVNELSLASTSQMLNAGQKDWDNDIINKLGISKEQLEKPFTAGSISGNLKNEFRSPSTKVVLAPAHDSASALAAIPATSNNFAFLSTGTWCVLGTESDTAFTSTIALESGITNEITADGRFRPLKNIMGLWLVQQLRQHIDPNLSYSEIEKLCTENESTRLLIDADDPSFYNPQNMMAAFDNYLAKHYKAKFLKPSDYFICAYESLADSFARNLKILEKLRGSSFDCLHLTGGGCQSKILCQLTANATKLTVHAGPVEGAAMGNILYQGIACGKIPGLQEAREIAKRSIDISSYYPL